jgi:guanylate kinase
MAKIMRPSFIVTGASASGKTTLIECAMENGYSHLPTHTTRTQRPGEIAGVHDVYLSDQEFEENFYSGMYIEESLDFAKLHSTGIYYGTPCEQIGLLSQDGYCSTPVSIKIARKIIDVANTNWIHLVCDDNDRIDRLRQRGISEEEIYSRMTSGDSINLPDDALIFNTSKLAADSLIKYIKQLNKE